MADVLGAVVAAQPPHAGACCERRALHLTEGSHSGRALGENDKQGEMQGIICMHGRMARWRVAARCRRLEGADRWHWVGGADRWVLPAGAGVGHVAFGLAIWLSVWPRPNAVGAVGEQAGQLAGAGAARWPAVQHGPSTLMCPIPVKHTHTLHPWPRLRKAFFEGAGAGASV